MKQLTNVEEQRKYALEGSIEFLWPLAQGDNLSSQRAKRTLESYALEYKQLTGEYYRR